MNQARLKEKKMITHFYQGVKHKLCTYVTVVLKLSQYFFLYQK
jgi:hypothetical protein